MKAWRLFERGAHNRPATLVHGWHGSRTLPLDVWMVAQESRRHNPGKSSGPGYVTGWHVGTDRRLVDEYRRKWFKYPERLVVCPVLVTGLRRKPRGRPGIFLARRMLVPAAWWFNAK